MESVDAGGARIPKIGLGTHQGRACVDAVQTALAPGYRHVDTAQMYENGAEVGRIDALTPGLRTRLYNLSPALMRRFPR